MTAVKRKFHQDPGHGWLCVKRSELEDLGIADRITSFSYQRNQSVYLEEDLDYTTYHDALRTRGIELEQVDGKIFDQPHPIRRFECYQPTPVRQAA